MFRVGVIEESIENIEVLKALNKYFVSQRIQNIPDDEFPVWHTNEYHVDERTIESILEILKDNIKLTWYCHAFSTEKMYVVLQGEWFEISLQKDKSWDVMIAYGTEIAKVEREYLENIPLHV